MLRGGAVKVFGVGGRGDDVRGGGVGGSVVVDEGAALSAFAWRVSAGEEAGGLVVVRVRVASSLLTGGSEEKPSKPSKPSTPNSRRYAAVSATSPARDSNNSFNCD